ncbi:putative serine esterase-domain-containing protein [Obelidium mucronatum]|nr:putative serine esterase-domain-containing protein [Obelidium mucronatum]
MHHLFVLQHGLWGDETHMNFIIETIKQKHSSEDIEFLNCALNTGTNTYAGIDGCGHILVKQILDRLKDESKPRVTHISFIGYSFGGLVVRYAIGVLFAKGLLCSGSSTTPSTEEASLDANEPRLIATHFITFASPHLGAPRTSPESALNPVFNNGAAVLAASTGTQMVLKDKSFRGRKAICLLADPNLPFWQGLELFKTRVCYGNILSDPLVPHYTATITPHPQDPKPLTKSQIKALQPIDPSYPSIVHFDASNLPSPDPLADEADKEPPKSVRERITTPLFYSLFITIALVALGGRRLFWEGIKTTRVVKRIATAGSGSSRVVAASRPPSSSSARLTRTCGDASQISGEWSSAVGYHSFGWLESWTTESSYSRSVSEEGEGGEEEIEVGVQGGGGDVGEKDVQDYAVRQLSKLAWDRVHVKSGFQRAHATIIRRADNFKGNEDVVQHFVDTYL